MTRFVVYRWAFERGGGRGRYRASPLGSRVAVAAFADRGAAEAYADQALRVARRRANPFALLNRLVNEEGNVVSHEYRVEKEDAAAVARLLALGLAFRVVPQTGWGRDRWLSWYDAEAPHLTDDERAKVWALFDARPLFGVYEVPAGDE